MLFRDQSCWNNEKEFVSYFQNQFGDSFSFRPGGIFVQSKHSWFGSDKKNMVIHSIIITICGRRLVKVPIVESCSSKEIRVFEMCPLIM